MANYDANDIWWNWNGDLSLGEDNDIKDTSEDYLLSLVHQIHDICASQLKDWEFYPRRSANLDELVGEPNNPITAEKIHDRLRLAIISANLVFEEDLDIKVIPVHAHEVLVIIRVRASPTEFNSLESGQLVVTQLAFDFLEQGVIFFQKKPLLINNP